MNPSRGLSISISRDELQWKVGDGAAMGWRWVVGGEKKNNNLIDRQRVAISETEPSE